MTRLLAVVFMNARGEPRAFWRLLLFLLLAVLVMALCAIVQPPIQKITELSAAAAGSAGALIGAVVAGVVVLVAVDKRRPGALGFAFTSQVPRELALGLGIAGGALTLVVAALALVGRVQWTPDAGTAGSYATEVGRDLLFWGVAAATEEALFRGYAFQVLVQGLGAVPATLVLSAGFALAHARNPNVDALALLNIFLAGVLLSVAYLRTRSLWFATAVHTGWNWTMGTLLALPVSGLSMVDTPLYDGHVGVPAWLTGGSFGPEGGLVATVAFALAIIGVAAAPVRETERMRKLGPLVDPRPVTKSPATTDSALAPPFPPGASLTSPGQAVEPASPAESGSTVSSGSPAEPASTAESAATADQSTDSQPGKPHA